MNKNYKDMSRQELIEAIKPMISRVCEIRLNRKGRIEKEYIARAIVKRYGEDVLYKILGEDRKGECLIMFLPDKFKNQLIPLTQAAFDPHDPEDEKKHPEKYVFIEPRTRRKNNTP